MKPTMILFLFLLVASTSVAQRGVRLTSRFSKRQKFFTEGSRVFYEYANSNHPMSISYSRYGHPLYNGIRGKGVLHVVNDSTIQVDQELIKIKDLMLFGPKNKGAWVGSFVLYWAVSRWRWEAFPMIRTPIKRTLIPR
jgi:hypothetical protein